MNTTAYRRKTKKEKWRNIFHDIKDTCTALCILASTYTAYYRPALYLRADLPKFDPNQSA